MDELRQSFESIRDKLKDLFNRVNQLEAAPTINAGGGGGAPVDAQYLTLAFNGILTAERRLDFSARFATVDGGANADYDVDLAASGVAPGVYGSATQVAQVTVDTYGRITTAANVAITGFVTGTSAAGRVAYWNGVSSITGEDELWYDAGNNRLGINDNTPSYTLDVNGIIGINGVQTIYNASALDVANFIGTIYFGNGGGSLSHTGGSEGRYNTAVGYNALLANTTGNFNTSVGATAADAITTGTLNTAIGYGAVGACVSDSQNTGVGYLALQSTNGGEDNTAVGSLSLAGNTTGIRNTAVGTGAGRFIASGGLNTTGERNTFIGAYTRANADGEEYEIAIGDLCYGNGSYTTTIGSVGFTTDAYIYGNHIIDRDAFVGRTGDVRITFDDLAGEITVFFGDNAGADMVLFVDSTPATVASINSNGDFFAAEYYTSDGGSFGISGNELFTVNAAGTFSFTGVFGVTVEDGDFIGNSAASARLIFNSAGATDYAYFAGCNVGFGTETTPLTYVHITGTTFPQLRVAYDADSAILFSAVTVGGTYQSNTIYNDTDDGTDNGILSIAGGGSAAVSRGAYISLYGNEHAATAANAGDVLIQAGNVSTGDILFHTQGVERGRFNYEGNLLVGTTTDDGVKLNVTQGTTTVDAILEVARIEGYVSTAATGSSAGFGTAIDLYSESATNGNMRQSARLATTWTVATDATRTSNIEEYVVTSASLVQISDRTSASQKFGGIAGSNYLNIDGDGDLSFFGTARIDWTKYTANSITLTVGTSANSVVDLRTAHDGLFYTLQEAAAAPAQNLIVDFVNVTAFNWVQAIVTYNGASNHAVAVQLYNWNTTSWDTFNACQQGQQDIVTASGYILEDHSFFIPNDANYIGTGGSAGQVRVRFYHTMMGNTSHYTYIDVVALYQ